MKIDLYTKVVLTFIAACLFYLCFGQSQLVVTGHAQSDQQKVVLAGWLDLRGNLHSFPVEAGNALPVTLGK